MQAGEALSSYLVRAAHRNRTAPYSFLNCRWPNRQVWTRDIDRTLDDNWLGELSVCSCNSLQGLRSGTFAAHVPKAVLSMPGDVPLVLSAGIFHRMRRRHGQMFCPRCLRDQEVTYFKITGRMAFVFACESCGDNLNDGCPNCDAPIAPHLSPVGRIDLCHDCGRRLSYPHAAQFEVPACVHELQRSLIECLGPDAHGSVGPFRGWDAIVVVRTLLAASRHRAVLSRLTRYFELEPRDLRDAEATSFEHARMRTRLALLELVAIWGAKWPDNFLLGARDAGMTALTFARVGARNVDSFRLAVESLSRGYAKERQRVPICADTDIQKLRRSDPDYFRRVRMRSILRVVDSTA